MATNPTVEGDGTSLYISNLLGGLPVRITRLARGITTGSVLEFANKEILADAMTGRQVILTEYAFITRSRPANGAEADSGAADDPVDGDSAVADSGVAGADRAGDGREPGSGGAGGGAGVGDSGGRAGGSRGARCPDRGRAGVGDRRGQFQRGGFRAADEDGRGVARPLRGALARFARGDRRGRRAQTRRDGQHGCPAAVAARLPARSIGLVRPGAGAAGDGRPDHL